MDPPFADLDENNGGRRRRQNRNTFPDTRSDAVATHPSTDSQQGGKDDTKTSESQLGVDLKDQIRKVNKVTFEVPLILEPANGGEGEDTVSSVIPKLRLTQNARCSIFCYVPASKPDGRWTGSVAGTSTIEKLVGSSNGAVELGCKLTPEYNARLGFEINNKATARPLQAHISVEQIDSNKDRIQLMAKQHSHNSLSLHCLTREIRDPWIATSNLSFYTRSRDWTMFFAATSMTTHVVRAGCGLTSVALNQGKYLLPLSTVQIALEPKLASNRRLPISFQYQPTAGTWQGSLALQNSMPTSSTIPSVPSSWWVGLRRGPANSILSQWSIVLAWQRGDFTLRIPIYLGTLTGMAQQQLNTNDGSILARATPYVLLAALGLANEMLSRVLWVSTDADELQTKKTQLTLKPNSSAKAQQDAAAQQKLMKRTAESRKAAELKKGGLVVESAVYKLGDEKWDVTVPLQFWVNTESSSIKLAAGSKQHLLGFYSLANEGAGNSNESEPSQQEPKIRWWEEYWTPTSRRQQSKAKKVQLSSPTLAIEYFYKGQAFEVVIGDEEELSLP